MRLKRLINKAVIRDMARDLFLYETGFVSMSIFFLKYVQGSFKR